MRYVLIGAALFLLEWGIAIWTGHEVELERLLLTILIPGVLEGAKMMAIKHEWPKRWAKNMLYPLIVEMVRYVLVIVLLMLVTSMLDKEKSLYAIAFCANFFVVIAVNTIVNWEKNKQ